MKRQLDENKNASSTPLRKFFMPAYDIEDFFFKTRAKALNNNAF